MKVRNVTKWYRTVHHNHIWVLLFLLLNMSCNGQEKKQSTQEESIKMRTVISEVRPIRTQGVTSGNFGCELVDRSGNIWFGSNGEGIYRYDGTAFLNFTIKDGLCDNYVSSIIEDKAGNILIGTRKGICRFDGKIFSTLTKVNDESKQSITTMLIDRNGSIWFGTWDNGIYRYDGKSFDNFLNKESRKSGLGSNSQLIVDMLQDRNGNIWCCSWNGGGAWRFDGKSFKNFLPDSGYYKSNEDGRNTTSTNNDVPLKLNGYAFTNDSIADDMIFSMMEDIAGNIWFATRRHGACRFDGTTFKSFREREGFVSYGINSIVQDKNNVIWLGTDKNGIYSYNGRIFKNYTETEGLVYNSVRSMVTDTSGNIWIATRGFGLTKFDGKIFTTFSEVQQ